MAQGRLMGKALIVRPSSTGGNRLSKLRIRDSLTTISTVWRRTFLDAFVAPRQFRANMTALRKASDMLVHPGIASLHPTQLPAHDEPLKILNIGAGYGGMPAQDLYALLRVVRWIQPKRIFEMGTFQGLTTAHMALNSDAEIYTLDLPRDLVTQPSGYAPKDLALLQSRQEIGRRYRGLNTNGRIHQLFGDSRTFDYKPYQATFDLVLVDACHLFDYVMSDSCNALALLRETGTILWHDFGNSMDVSRACRLLSRKQPVFHLEGTWLAMHIRGPALVQALDERQQLETRL